jgi:hypothetical protein
LSSNGIMVSILSLWFHLFNLTFSFRTTCHRVFTVYKGSWFCLHDKWSVD